jgi:hypothetical protein
MGRSKLIYFITRTITETIIQSTTVVNATETNVIRMVLRPQILKLKEQFRNQIDNQINNSTKYK